MTKKPDRAAKHESNGDAHLAKGKPEKALKEYRKALEANPEHPGIFDKLMTARDRLPGDWKLEDFVESVSWTMKKQEAENPCIKQVHAKLTPEWSEATALAIGLMTSASEEEAKEITEKLVAKGEVATRALIDMILNMKQQSVILSEAKNPMDTKG